MSTEPFLKKLDKHDIRLSACDDRLQRSTPEIGAELATRKAETISMSRQAAKSLEDLSHIGRAPRDLPLPLSFARQRLWFLHEIEHGSSVYNVTAFRFIIGRLDAKRMGESLAQVVERHEILPTVFHADPGLFWAGLAKACKVFYISGEDSGSLLKKPCVQGFDDILAAHLGNTGARS